MIGACRSATGLFYCECVDVFRLELHNGVAQSFLRPIFDIGELRELKSCVSYDMEKTACTFYVDHVVTLGFMLQIGDAMMISH